MKKIIFNQFLLPMQPQQYEHVVTAMIAIAYNNTSHPKSNIVYFYNLFCCCYIIFD